MAKTVKSVQLKALTVQAFEAYIRDAEEGMEQTLHGSEPFLWSDVSSERARQVREGDIVAQFWSARRRHPSGQSGLLCLPAADVASRYFGQNGDHVATCASEDTGACEPVKTCCLRSFPSKCEVPQIRSRERRRTPRECRQAPGTLEKERIMADAIRTAPRDDRVLCGLAITFAIAEEINLLKQEPEWVSGTRNSVTVVKTSNLSIVLTAVKKGTTWKAV